MLLPSFLSLSDNERVCVQVLRTDDGDDDDDRSDGTYLVCCCTGDEFVGECSFVRGVGDL